MRWVALLWLAAVLAAQEPATSPVAAFDRAAADSPAGDAAAARHALALFLQLPAGTERSDRLPQAVELASAAADRRMVGRLAEEAVREHRATGSTFATWLACLADEGDLDALRRATQVASSSGHDVVVAALLVGRESELLRRADRRLRDGDQAAGWVFEDLARLQPAAALRLANLALAQRHLGQLDEAARSYRTALVQAPADPWIWNDYGLLLRVRGDAAAAEVALRRAVALEPQPGATGALTNLLALAARAGRPVAPADLEAAAAALAQTPDAALLRRVTLDALLAAATKASPQNR